MLHVEAIKLMPFSRRNSGFKNEFRVAIWAFGLSIDQCQIDLRMAKSSATAITGNLGRLNFNDFGRYWRLRHSRIAFQHGFFNGSG